MVFSSTTFLFLFLPLVLVGYFLFRSIKVKNLFLLLTSLLFYSWGEGALVLLMIASILVNFGVGWQLDRTEVGVVRKRWLVLGIVANLGLLFFYKYANFFVANLNVVLNWSGKEGIEWSPIHLPIGISFFTFQAISYVVDVYWKKVAAQRNPLRVALYISLFPQLIAGPIVRYETIAAQLKQRVHTWDKISLGMQRFTMGLAKKVLIADTLGYTADQIFGHAPTLLDASTSWLGVICYAFQIYFDFSAYSDMAIGLGLIFGFNIPENFRYPYIARSVREFWRRWHISLSTWFRDYLYIPLGGNRQGTVRTYVNLLIVFFLCGFWHGASWNFVVWGLFHGFFLVIERMAFGRVLKRLPAVVGHAYLIVVVLLSWVFFRAEDLPHALQYFQAMFGGMPQSTYYVGFYLSQSLWFTLGCAILFSMPVFHWLPKQFEKWSGARPYLPLVYFAGLAILLVLSISTVIISSYNPFIYFRF